MGKVFETLQEAICLSENYLLIQHNNDFILKVRITTYLTNPLDLKYPAFADLQQRE